MNIGSLQSTVIASDANVSLNNHTECFKNQNDIITKIKHVVLPILGGIASLGLGGALISYDHQFAGVAVVFFGTIGSAVATAQHLPKDYSNQVVRSKITTILSHGSLKEFADAANGLFNIEDLADHGFLTKAQLATVTLTYQDYISLVAELNRPSLCESRTKDEVQDEIDQLSNHWKYYQDGEIRASEAIL